MKGGSKSTWEEVVPSTVEEILNAMLDAGADWLCRAQRYERTARNGRTRAGSYRRQVHTKVGEVTLKVPLKGSPKSGHVGSAENWP